MRASRPVVLPEQLAPWPAWDEALAVDDVIELPVQLNGKVRHVRLYPVAA